MTARFYVDADLAVGRALRLPPSAAHHASHVLRLRDGDPIVLFNGRGGEYHAVLAERATRADVTAFDAIERESPLAVTLLQAWVSTDKIDWIVEKAVELGAVRIALFPARRSVVRMETARREKRLARLREIAIAASSQSGRNRLAAIDSYDDAVTAFSSGAGAGVRSLILDPRSTESLVNLAGAGTEPIALAVGPEGGFEASEITLAERAGLRSAHLGPRTLRTESAGLAALAALQSVAGDFR